MSAADWRPAASPEVLRERAAMLARIRAYFAAGDVLEVQTPMLSAAAVSDVHLRSVTASVPGHGVMYLQTSPEYPMKRLLAAGIGDCYQVCPVFRGDEAGRHHNPEFTMVEWYRCGMDAAALQADVDRLLRAACLGQREFAPSQALRFRDAVRAGSGIDCVTASADELLGALRSHGIDPDPGSGLDRDALLDLLVGAIIGPGLGRDAPLFLTDYPASQAALARVRDDGDGWAVAERFELYVDGIELANGFHELGDAAEQRRRFERDLEIRDQRGQPRPPLDERLLAALPDLPDCAGVALGLDRLMMIALRLPSVAAAMSFPIDRA